MSLVGPWLSTTSTKKRKEKISKSKQSDLEQGWRERNRRLKEMHLSKETFDQYLVWVYGRGKKETKKDSNREQYSQTETTQISGARVEQGRKTNNVSYKSLKTWVTGTCSTKPSPTYTGEKVIGVAVLHKSCLQPVFSSEEAIDIARMRR